MTTRVDLRLPPLKFLITGALSLVLLIHLVTLHTSDTYARHASIESLRSKLGLSSDGMPVVWRGGQASRVGGGAAKTGGVQEWEGDGASVSFVRRRCIVELQQTGSGGGAGEADLVVGFLLPLRRRTQLAQTPPLSFSPVIATFGMSSHP